MKEIGNFMIWLAKDLGKAPLFWVITILGFSVILEYTVLMYCAVAAAAIGSIYYFFRIAWLVYQGQQEELNSEIKK